MHLTAIGHTEPVPRRIRGVLAGETVFDTVAATYVWEKPQYPQYYIPLADIREGVLGEPVSSQHTRRGEAEVHGLTVGAETRPQSVKAYGQTTIEGLADVAHFDWDALDAWYEEDERVFVHPRSPYVRVDALRSTRPLRVELDGVRLAQSAAPVMVFETGLPTRYYVERTALELSVLVPSSTETACPYNGKTREYWSAQISDTVHEDVAWGYEFPTRQLLPIAGMVAFYNEHVDLFLDGRELPRPG